MTKYNNDEEYLFIINNIMKNEEFKKINNSLIYKIINLDLKTIIKNWVSKEKTYNYIMRK